jgi:ADP-heptose:LPS heptosyltransferase
LKERLNVPGLFITSSRIGDAVMTLSLIEALRHENPALTYHVAADPLVAPLFVDDPACQHIIPFHKQKASLHWFHLWRKTVTKRWEWVLDTRGSAVRFFLRSGWSWAFRSAPNDRRKKIEQLCAAINRPPQTPRIYVSQIRDQRIQNILPKGPLLAVAPIANWVGKQWPLERYTTLLIDFCSTFPKAHVIVLSAPHEAPLLKPLIDALPQDRIHNGPELSQKHALHLLDQGAILKNSTLFLGNDSGLMHMAYGVHCPVIALFGPSRSTVYGPTPTTDHTVIRIPMTYDDLYQQPNFSHTSQTCYMDTLLVDTVRPIVYEQFCRHTP